MYAEKNGVGSVLSPLEMIIPRGSDDAISLRSFFILILGNGFTTGFERFIGTRHAMLDSARNLLNAKGLRIPISMGRTRVSQNDTPIEDTCVVTTRWLSWRSF
jgi:hypothetical protein